MHIFAWLASEGRVSTCDLVQRRRPSLCISPSWCALCKSIGEDIDHNLLNFKFFSFIWSKVFKELGLSVALSLTWHDFILIDWCLSGIRKKKIKCGDVS